MNDRERAAFEAAIERELNYGFDFKQDPSGNYLHDATDTAWIAWQARAALEAAPVQAVPKEPLFLLHTGGLYGNERDAWEVQANSQTAVDELCNAQPLDTVLHLYALTPAAPQVPAAPGYTFLVRDVAEMLDASVPDVCKALMELGRPERSTNMAVTHEEGVAVAKHLKASPSAAPQPAVRAPLSDEQIAEISVSCALVTPSDIYFARAIEAAISIRAAGVKEPLNAGHQGREASPA